MGETSKVAKASSKSPSLRITIPESIVRQMGIRVGDVMDWEVYLDSESRRALRVRKLQVMP